MELVISIVVIGIAVAGVVLAMSQSTRRSADPMVLHQAVAVAESYLEEILLLPYDETAASGAAENYPAADPGEAGRADFDDVNDYHNLNDVGARSLSNPATTIAGLGVYTVNVSVFNNDGNLGPAGKKVPVGDAERIEVQVTQPAAGVDITVSGYRTRY